MSTTTLTEKPRQFFVANEGQVPHVQNMRKFARKNSGGGTTTVLALDSVPVFRSGTFRDSWGEQMTWTDMHIMSMVQHFNYLKDTGAFADVPVRKGHVALFQQPMDTLIGHLTGLRHEKLDSPVDGSSYSYLLADYEILDPDAIAKIESGLWRNRSAEIGMFVTNNEEAYDPVFLGFGYVDIPAVEGLHLNGFSKSGEPKPTVEFSALTMKENQVTTTTASFDKNADPMDDDPFGSGESKDSAPSGSPDPGTGEQTSADKSGAPAGGAGSTEVNPATPPVEDGGDDSDKDDEEPIPVQERDLPPAGVGADPEESDDDDEDEDEPEPIQQTEHAPGPVFENGVLKGHFTIAGKKVKDFSQVQAFINKTESDAAKRATKARERFCRQLAEDEKILASALDATIEFATSLTPAQYDKWKAAQALSPKLGLFGRQAGGEGNSVEELAQTTKAYETSVEIVKSNFKGGVKGDRLKATASFARGMSLGKQIDRDFLADAGLASSEYGEV